mgnify:CR=1 FL=1
MRAVPFRPAPLKTGKARPLAGQRKPPGSEDAEHRQGIDQGMRDLQDQKDLILQGLVVATSEQELFLNRGKWALVEHLDKLKEEVKVTLETKEDN